MIYSQLSSVINSRKLRALKGQRLGEEHFTTLYAESVEVRGDSSALVAVLLKGAIPQQVAIDVLPFLLEVEKDGDLKNRAAVIGAGAQMSIQRVDGSIGPRKGVPKSVLQAHGGRGNQLGFMEGRNAEYCRETGWTQKRPDILSACLPLIGYVNKAYRQTMPEAYGRQMAKVDLVTPELRLGTTAFTTVTVNLNNRCAAHTDRGDVRDGLGCLTTHGEFSGGFFIMPRYGVAFDIQPGDLLLADVHQLHANAEIFGQRVSCVYYAREKMHLCRSKVAA